MVVIRVNNITYLGVIDAQTSSGRFTVMITVVRTNLNYTNVCFALQLYPQQWAYEYTVSVFYNPFIHNSVLLTKQALPKKGPFQ